MFSKPKGHQPAACTATVLVRRRRAGLELAG